MVYSVAPGPSVVKKKSGVKSDGSDQPDRGVNGIGTSVQVDKGGTELRERKSGLPAKSN